MGWPLSPLEYLTVRERVAVAEECRKRHSLGNVELASY